MQLRRQPLLVSLLIPTMQPTVYEMLRPGIYAIRAAGSKPLIYAPLQGIVLQGNDALCRIFKGCHSPPPEALAAIGLTEHQFATFCMAPQEAQAYLEPRWPETFEPTDVTLFLTQACTMSCSYCYCHGGKGSSMPWERAKAALDLAIGNARRLKRHFSLNLHGGDVGACWPLFQACVRYVEAQCGTALPYDISLGTNGLYSEEQVRYICEHTHSATVSIDGTPDVHDRYRRTVGGKPTAAAILKTVKIMERRGYRFSFRMTVTAESVDWLPESVDYLCANSAVKLIRAEPMYERGRAQDQALLSPDPWNFIRGFRRAREVAASYQRTLSYSGSRIGGLACSFCSYPNPTFGVTHDGNLTSCYEVLHTDDPLRDSFFYGLLECDGRLTVDWERVRRIRHGALELRNNCLNCFCAFSCAGGCAVKMMDGPSCSPADPARCIISRELTSDLLMELLDPSKPETAAAEGSRASLLCRRHKPVGDC